MIVYIAGCAALIVLRRRPDAPRAGFHAPFGYFFAVLAIVLSVALLANASALELTQLAIASALGVVVHLAMRRRNQAARSTSSEGAASGSN
jgi:amino acid transporter